MQAHAGCGQVVPSLRIAEPYIIRSIDKGIVPELDQALEQNEPTMEPPVEPLTEKELAQMRMEEEVQENLELCVKYLRATGPNAITTDEQFNILLQIKELARKLPLKFDTHGRRKRTLQQ